MPATPRGMRPAGASVNIDRVRRAGVPARASVPCQPAWRIPCCEGRHRFPRARVPEVFRPGAAGRTQPRVKRRAREAG
jgi:hypothetical protein